MEFADNTIREATEEVFVIRTETEMEAREEFNSLAWDIERVNFLRKGQHLYQTLTRDVKIGEKIYTKAGRYLTYRTT